MTDTQLLEKILIKLESLEELKSQVQEHTQILKSLQELKPQMQEHTQLLRSLEHPAQVTKAEVDKINYEIVEMQGDLKAIRKELNIVEIVTKENTYDIARLKAIK